MKCNGKTLNWEPNQTLFDLLEDLSYQGEQKFAVAINGVFIAEKQYKSKLLQKDDVIDIVKPIAGG